MIVIKEKFIKLEVNIPRDEIKNFIIEIASTLNNLSKNNIESQPIIIKKKLDTELFSVSDVARKLKVNTDSVYRLIKSGNLLALKLGSLKATSTELERFINYSIGKDLSDLENIKDLNHNNPYE